MDCMIDTNDLGGDGIAYSSGGASCGGGRQFINGRGVDLPIRSFCLSIAFKCSTLCFSGLDTLTNFSSRGNSVKSNGITLGFTQELSLDVDTC